MNLTTDLYVDEYVSTEPNNTTPATMTSLTTAADFGNWVCYCCNSESGQSESGIEEVEADCYPRLLHVVGALDRYLTPIIVGVGIVGNVVSFLVFTATYLRRMSSSVYLAALAIVDTVFLLLVFCNWLMNFGIKAYHQDGWCQLFVYLMYVVSFLSVWFVVCFTVERYLIIRFPLKRQQICRPRRAKVVVFSLVGMALLLYNFAIWTSEVSTLDQHEPVCQPRYTNLVTAINNVDTVITLVLPSIIIIISNIRISYTLSVFYRSMQQDDHPLVGPQTSNDSQNQLLLQCHHHQPQQEQQQQQQQQRSHLSHPEEIYPAAVGGRSCGESGGRQAAGSGGSGERVAAVNPTGGSASMTIGPVIATIAPVAVGNIRSSPVLPKGSQDHVRNGRYRSSWSRRSWTLMNGIGQSDINIYNNSSNDRLQMKVTTMLLLVSTVFLLFNIPSHAVRVYVFIESSLNDEYQPGHLLVLVQKLTQHLFYASFSTNFILYSASGRAFRRATKRLAQCIAHRIVNWGRRLRHGGRYSMTPIPPFDWGRRTVLPGGGPIQRCRHVVTGRPHHTANGIAPCCNAPAAAFSVVQHIRGQVMVPARTGGSGDAVPARSGSACAKDALCLVRSSSAYN